MSQNRKKSSRQNNFNNIAQILIENTKKDFEARNFKVEEILKQENTTINSNEETYDNTLEEKNNITKIFNKILTDEININFDNYAKKETQKQVTKFLNTTHLKKMNLTKELEATTNDNSKNTLDVAFQQASTIISQLLKKQVKNNPFKNCSVFIEEADRELFDGLEYAEILSKKSKNRYSRMIKEYSALKDLVS